MSREEFIYYLLRGYCEGADETLPLAIIKAHLSVWEEEYEERYPNVSSNMSYKLITERSY